MTVKLDTARRQVDGAALYIDGGWRPAASGESIESFDPNTGKVIGRIPRGGDVDVDAAVGAAKRAAVNWQFSDPKERITLLWRLADLVDEHADELAWLEALDSGHYLDKSQSLVQGVSDWIRYHAGMADKVGGRTIPTSSSRLSFTLLEPLGVTAHIIPWNYPLVLLVRSVAPALALGNTVVVKPAEDTSLSALRFTELVHEVGFPPGVFNLVTGYGAEAGAALAAHPDVAGITFTGSVETGKIVTKLAADNVARVNLELGGKSPNIVFADADLDDAVEAAIQGFCSHTGQVCIAGSRLFLHEDIETEFLSKLVGRLSDAKIGDSFDPATQIGPLVSAKQLERVRSYIELGKSEATLYYGGGQPNGTDEGGYFVEPTIFTNVTNSARIAREEIFGPVLSVITWSDVEDLIAQANDSLFGLFASVWTRDIKQALRTARRLQVGGVMVNDWQSESPIAPHGGYKQSGNGRENGLECVENYTQIKHISVNLEDSLVAGGDWAQAPL